MNIKIWRESNEPSSFESKYGCKIFLNDCDLSSVKFNLSSVW